MSLKTRQDATDEAKIINAITKEIEEFENNNDVSGPSVMAKWILIALKEAGFKIVKDIQMSIGKPILVTCEESQMVTMALLELGYDAWSNDIEPTRGAFPQRHLQMDARQALKEKDWGGFIAHPVCKGLAGSGSKHQYVNMKKFNRDGSENPLCETRNKLIVDGVEFFQSVL